MLRLLFRFVSLFHRLVQHIRHVMRPGVMTAQQSGRRYLYPACCPPNYPCVANSYTYVDAGVSYDVSSFWCRNQSFSSSGGGSHLTWLWWLVAVSGISVLSYIARRCYWRYRYSRGGVPAQQQQQQQQAAGLPEQELLGQPGPWSEEVQQRAAEQSYSQYPPQQQVPMPGRLLPTYLPPGTYAQMP